MQRLSGLIDGSAPPFIILVLIMGALYNAQQALKSAEETPSGVTFKSPVRRIVFFSMGLFLFLTCLIMVRIVRNGLTPGSDFTTLDIIILIGLFLSYALLTLDALILSRLKRKYTPEAVNHLPPETAEKTDSTSV